MNKKLIGLFPCTEPRSVSFYHDSIHETLMPAELSPITQEQLQVSRIIWSDWGPCLSFRLFYLRSFDEILPQTGLQTRFRWDSMRQPWHKPCRYFLLRVRKQRISFLSPVWDNAITSGSNRIWEQQLNHEIRFEAGWYRHKWHFSLFRWRHQEHHGKAMASKCHPNIEEGDNCYQSALRQLAQFSIPAGFVILLLV